MNRIIIENDVVVSSKLDKKVEFSFLKKSENFMVNKLVIDIVKDSDLELLYKNETGEKLDILIRIAEGVKARIFEFRTGKLIKVQYRYELDTNSLLTIGKFYHCEGMKELDTIYLKGEHAKIEYTLKTISKGREKYDITVYHQAKHTESLIRTGGVNILNGSLNIHVSGMVPNGKIGCVLDQNNQIINLNHNKCSIHPNLFIDEYDVTANHSAWIGKFMEEELFYLKSRGLEESKAINLLVKGFLLSNLDISLEKKEEIVNIVNEYWR